MPKYHAFGKGGMKRDTLTNLDDLPNIGPAMVRDFERIGITAPRQLCGKDPYALYNKLCRVTGKRHDPCVLDTFISAVRFMDGAPAKPWWAYTAERKKTLQKQTKVAGKR